MVTHVKVFPFVRIRERYHSAQTDLIWGNITNVLVLHVLSVVSVLDVSADVNVRHVNK